MTYPRCTLPGLLLYVSYITSYGLWQCALSSSILPANYDVNKALREAGSMASFKPWFQRYVTNPNQVYTTTPPGQDIPTSCKTCLIPQDARRALKKSPGNYLYPDIPGHRAPIHACLAGYDSEIYSIMNEISETSGNELEVHFYMFQSCKFHLLGSHLTTIKAIQDILANYHHYICLNKKYVESYSEKDQCWYIEKLIMLPSSKREFESLPKHLGPQDFDIIFDSSKPLALEIDEKINPDKIGYIHKIKDYYNKYEVKLDDIASGKRKVFNDIISTDNADIKYDTQYSQGYTPYSSYSTASNLKQNVYSSTFMNLPYQMQQIPYVTAANLPAKKTSDFRQQYDTILSNLPQVSETSAYTAPTLKSTPRFSPVTYTTSQATKAIHASEYIPVSSSIGSPVAYAATQKRYQQSYNQISSYSPAKKSPVWPDKNRQEVLNSIPWDYRTYKTKYKEANVNYMNYVTSYTKPGQLIPKERKEYNNFVRKYTPLQKIGIPDYETVTLQQKPVGYASNRGYAPLLDKDYSVYFSNKPIKGENGQYISSGQNAKPDWLNNVGTYKPKQISRGKFSEYFQGSYSPTSQNINNFQIKKPKWLSYQTVTPVYRSQDNGVRVPYDTVWAQPTLSAIRPQTWLKKIVVQPVHMTSFKPVPLQGVQKIGYGEPNFDIISSYTPRENVGTWGMRTANNFPQNALSTSLDLTDSKPECLPVGEVPIVINPDFKVFTQPPKATPKYDSITSYSQTLKPELTSVVQPYIQPLKDAPYNVVTIPFFSQQSYTVKSDSVSALSYSEQPKATSENYVSTPTYTSSPLKLRPTFTSALPRYQRPEEFVSISSYIRHPSYYGQPSTLGSDLTSRQLKYSQWPQNILKTGGSVPIFHAINPISTIQQFKSNPSYIQLPLKPKPVSATLLPSNKWPQKTNNYVSLPYSKRPLSISPKLPPYTTLSVNTGFSTAPSFTSQMYKPNSVSAQPYFELPKSNMQGFTEIPSYTQTPLTATTGTEPILGSSGLQSRPTYVSLPVNMISTNSQTSSKQEYVEVFASYPVKRIKPLKTHVIITPQKGPTPQPYRYPYTLYQNKILEYQPIEATREPIATALDNSLNTQRRTGVTNNYVSIPWYTKPPSFTPTVIDSTTFSQEPLEINPYVEVTRYLPKWPYSMNYETQYAPQRVENPFVSIPSYAKKLLLPSDFVSGVLPKRPISSTQNYVTIPNYTQQPLKILHSQWPKGVSKGLDSQQMISPVSVGAQGSQDFAALPYTFPSQSDTQSGIKSKPGYNIRPTGTSPDSVQSFYTPGALEERPQLVSVQPITKPPHSSTQNFVSYTQHLLRYRPDSNRAPYTYHTLPGKILLGSIPSEYKIPSNTKPSTRYTSIPSYTQEVVVKPSVYDPYYTQGPVDRGSTPSGSMEVPSEYTVISGYTPPSHRQKGFPGYHNQLIRGKSVEYVTIPSYDQAEGPNSKHDPSRFQASSNRESRPPGSIEVPPGYDIIYSYAEPGVRSKETVGVPQGFYAIPSYSQILNGKPLEPKGDSTKYDSISSYTPAPSTFDPSYSVVPIASGYTQDPGSKPCYDTILSYTRPEITPSISSGPPSEHESITSKLYSRYAIPSYSTAGGIPLKPAGVSQKYYAVPKYTKPRSWPSKSIGDPSNYDVFSSYTPSGVKPIGSPGIFSGYDLIASYSPTNVKPIALHSTAVPSSYDVVPSYSSSSGKSKGHSRVHSGYYVVPSSTSRKPLGPIRTSSKYSRVPTYTKLISWPTVPSCSLIESTSPPYDVVPFHSPVNLKPVGSTGVPSGYNVVPSYSPSDSKPIGLTKGSGYDIVPSYSGEKPLGSSAVASGYDVLPSYSLSDAKPIGAAGIPSGYDVDSSHSPESSKTLGLIGARPRFNSILSYALQSKRPSVSAGVPLQYDTSYALPGVKPSECNTPYFRSPYYTIPSYSGPESKQTKVPLGYTTIPSNSQPSSVSPEYDTIISHNQPSARPAGPAYNTISTPFGRPISVTEVPQVYKNNKISSYIPSVSRPLWPIRSPSIRNTIPCYTLISNRPAKSTKVASEYTIEPISSPASSKPSEYISSYTQRPSGTPSYDTIPSYTGLGSVPLKSVGVSHGIIPCYSRAGGRPTESESFHPEYNPLPSFSKILGERPKGRRPFEFAAIPLNYNNIPSYIPPIGSAGVTYTSIPYDPISRDEKLSPEGKLLKYDTTQSYSQGAGDKPSGSYYSQIPSGRSSYNTIPSYNSRLSRPVGTSKGYKTIPYYTGPVKRPGEGYTSYETIPSYSSPGRQSRVSLGYDTIPSYTTPGSKPLEIPPLHDSFYSYNRPKNISPAYNAIPCYILPYERLLGPIGISPSYIKSGIKASGSAGVFPEFNTTLSYSNTHGDRPSYYNIPSYSRLVSRPMKSVTVPLKYNVISSLSQELRGKRGWPLAPKGESLGYVSILSNRPGPVGRSSGYNLSYPQRFGSKPSHETISSYTFPARKPPGVPSGYEIIPSYTGPGRKPVNPVGRPLDYDYVSSYTQRPDGRYYDAIPGGNPSRISQDYNVIPSYSPRDVRVLNLTRVPPGYEAFLSYGPSDPIRHRAGHIAIPFSNGLQSRLTGVPLSFDTISSYTSPGGRPSGLPENYDSIPSYTHSSRPIEGVTMPLRYDVIPAYSQKLRGISTKESVPLLYQYIPTYTQTPTAIHSRYSPIPNYTQAPTQEVPVGYDYISSYTQSTKPTGSIPSYSQEPLTSEYESISPFTNKPTLTGSGYGPIRTITQKLSGKPIKSQTVTMGYDSIPSYTPELKPSQYTTIPTYSHVITPLSSGYGPISSQGRKPLGSQEVPVENISIPSYAQRPPSGFVSVPSNTQEHATTSFEKQLSISIPFYTRRPIPLEYNNIPLYSQGARPKYNPIVPYNQGSNSRPIGSRGPLWYNLSDYGRLPSGSISSLRPTPSKYESIPSYTKEPTRIDFEKDSSSSVPSYSQSSSPSGYETIPSYTQPPTSSASGYNNNPTQGPGVSLGYKYIPLYTQGPTQSGEVPLRLIPSSTQGSPPPDYYTIPSHTLRPGINPLRSIPSFYKKPTMSVYTSIPNTKWPDGRLSDFNKIPTGYYSIPSFTQKPKPLVAGHGPMTFYNHGQGVRPIGSEGVPLRYNSIPHYLAVPLRTLPGIRSIPSYTTTTPTTDTQQPFKTSPDFSTTIPSYQLSKQAVVSFSRPYQTIPEYSEVPAYTSRLPTESLIKYNPIVQNTKPSVSNAPSEQPYITLKQPSLLSAPYGKLSSITRQPDVQWTPYEKPYFITRQPYMSWRTTHTSSPQYFDPYIPAIKQATSGAPLTTTRQPDVPWLTSFKPLTAARIPYESTNLPSVPYTVRGIPYTAIKQPSAHFTTIGTPGISSVVPFTTYSVNTPSVSSPYTVSNSVANNTPYITPSQYTGQPYLQQSSQYQTVCQQPTDKTNGDDVENNEFCKALQENDMSNVNNINIQSLIDRVKYCMANSLLKINVSDKHLKDQCVPLGNIVVANTRFENQKPFFLKTVNGVEVKGYMNKVKVLKAKIVYEADEVDVPNFVPVVKCGDTRDPKQLQNLVANIVKNMYHEEPVLLKGPGPTDQDHLVMKNLNLDGEKAFVWPAVCENNVHYSHKGSCPQCRH